MNASPFMPRPRRNPAALIVAALVIAAVALYAGVRWHDPFERLLGHQAAAAAPQSAGPRQLWTCGMHPQVIQDHPGTCPICHMDLTPLKTDLASALPASSNSSGAAQPVTGSAQPPPEQARKVKYWWDPMMNPPYISDKPGKSPMGMDLVPVYEDEAPAQTSGAAVTIDPAVVQNMGVRTAVVSEGPLSRPVRLVGYLDEAQPNIRDINLRVSGWIKHLYASTEGMHVEAGDPLFDVYSPDLQVAMEELIASRRARNAAGTGDTGAALYEAAAKKLELLGLERAQIEALAKLDKAPESITFTSPIAGDVTEKPVVEGAAVKSGDRVLRIVDHSTLWLDAQMFEKDLPFVRTGQKVSASIASQPGMTQGEIIFVAPRLDATTRTALARLSIQNPSLALKPGMYATVSADAPIAERAVLVPREAVIDTGEEQVAFVALPGGRFDPRRVRAGQTGANGMVQVLDGLKPGESVVTSGQFLLDSESRLREAIQKFLSEKQQAGAGQPARPEPAPKPSGAKAPTQENVDGVAAAYLAISTVLGAPERTETPIDPTPLIAAANTLAGDQLAGPVNTLASAVARAAESMRGHSLNEQREAFKAVSQRMIALSEAAPPSATVGEALYVMHCPMAKADWVQKDKEVANPYYATDMKSCGALTKTIEARGGAQP